MQNGKNAKRPAPSDQQDGDDRKPKKKKDPAESELRRSLDMCSKFADAMGAIEIYEKVVAEGKLQFNQYNYNVLLYLCSSAATGSLKRGKSGTTEKQRGEPVISIFLFKAPSYFSLSNSCKFKSKF